VNTNTTPNATVQMVGDILSAEIASAKDYRKEIWSRLFANKVERGATVSVAAARADEALAAFDERFTEVSK
jgi:hypothetical protein